jgi:hypothetical protein
MTHLSKLLTFITLLALGAVQARADQSNLVQDLSIQITGLKQGGTTTNRNSIATGVDFVAVGTRQVIDALGAAVGSSFSRSARLVMVTPLAGGYPTFQVRDGNNMVEVSSFFTYEQSDSVGTSVVNLRTGRATSSQYNIQRLALTDPGNFTPLTLHFDLRGLATGTSTSPANYPGDNETDIDATGAGDRNGNLLILQGTIRIRGNTIEVSSDPIVT